MKKIIRVFPRRTNATPTDALVRIAEGPLFWDEADEVHISVTFTWDIPAAEYLEKQWRHIAPVTVGGPALGTVGGEFVPGLYIGAGYTITSRGCPNKCWFCDVWKRDGAIRELPIRDGWRVADDNILACSDEHIKNVFAMLERQKNPIHFCGGLEAARLKPWHVKELRKLRPIQMFFAYDTPDDLEPLRRAGKMMLEAGWSVVGKRLRCYILCGYPKDTFDKAESRFADAMAAGFTPMAMLYRDKKGEPKKDWAKFQRRWARAAMIGMGNGSIH